MKSITIYLADDDVDDREVFIDALEEIPLVTETSQFENGIELMADLYSDKPLPDSIFLDLHMPMMDGFECLDDIRNVPEFSAVQVIIYSTSHNKEEIEGLRISGANQYIRKPCSFNQLKTLLYQSLNFVVTHTHEEGEVGQFEVLI